jgi:imidazolonepropionase-like amidohydrolase
VNLRAFLRPPIGEPVVRDIVDGQWRQPAGAADQMIGEEMWALPGLVDAHAHLAADEMFAPSHLDGAVNRAKEALAAGVTLIIDKGWSDRTVVELIDQVAAESRPDVEAAAEMIAAPDGYMPGFGLRVEPATLGRVVETQAEIGRGWVKLIGDWPRKGIGPVANFDEGQLRAAVEAAESLGARVAIHTMAREVPSMAVAAGVHSIEHGLFLGDEDLDRLGARRGLWVPTVLRCEATRAQIGPESSGGRLLGEGLQALPELLQKGFEAGVRVLAGTDLIGAPRDVAAEARRLAEYGLSNSQALAAVSTNGFLATDRSHDFGVGGPADVAFFPANPLDELGVLAHPGLVLRLGRIV